MSVNVLQIRFNSVVSNSSTLTPSTPLPTHLTPSDSSADMCNSCKCSLHIVVAIAGLVAVAVAFAMVGFALDFGVWKTCTNNKTKTKAKMKSLYELF